MKAANYAGRFNIGRKYLAGATRKDCKEPSPISVLTPRLPKFRRKYWLCSRNLWTGSLGELLVLETGCSGAEASNHQGAKHARVQTEPDCSGTADIAYWPGPAKTGKRSPACWLGLYLLNPRAKPTSAYIVFLSFLCSIQLKHLLHHAFPLITTTT